MKNLTTWMKSTRSILAVVVVLTISVGLMTGVIAADQYMNVALIVIGAYFVKRDGEKPEAPKD